MFAIYKKGDISPRISNSVLDEIINTEVIKSVPQKVFAYCYLGLISYFNINNKYKTHNIKVGMIKEYLGYSEINKKVDYIIKKEGVLEQLGFITDEPNPYTENTKNRIKVPLILDEMEDCHTFNLRLFFECMKDEKLGLTGFFIANYIKEFQSGYVYGVRGSINQLSKMLSMSSSTVGNYLELLAAGNLINKTRIRKQDTLADMSLYFRGKLNEWRNQSLEYHNGKCFVTGENRNLIVHHLIPFNQIRDYVINNLKLDNKNFSEFTKEELFLIEERMKDYHQLSVGVPLTKKVHEQFHRRYGNYSTLEDLLEFKYQYTEVLVE